MGESPALAATTPTTTCELTDHEVPRCYHFVRRGHRQTWVHGQSEEDRTEKREGHSGALFPLVSIRFFSPRCELCQLLLSSGAVSPPMLVACHHMSAINS